MFAAYENSLLYQHVVTDFKFELEAWISDQYTVANKVKGSNVYALQYID